MNHVPRRNGSVDEIAHIRKVVSRHRLPDFVNGFEVRLGEFMDAPAMWIVFKTIGSELLSEKDLHERVAIRIALKQAVLDDLLENFDDRWPYFRFERAE